MTLRDDRRELAEIRAHRERTARVLSEGGRVPTRRVPAKRDMARFTDDTIAPTESAVEYATRVESDQ